MLFATGHALSFLAKALKAFKEETDDQLPSKKVEETEIIEDMTAICRLWLEVRFPTSNSSGGENKSQVSRCREIKNL